jgi:hypothetical protein
MLNGLSHENIVLPHLFNDRVNLKSPLIQNLDRGGADSQNLYGQIVFGWFFNYQCFGSGSDPEYFLIKNCNYLSLSSIRTSKLLEKPSALNREHPALPNMKFLNFFSIFVGHFCPPGSGSTDLIESGSETLLITYTIHVVM